MATIALGEGKVPEGFFRGMMDKSSQKSLARAMEFPIMDDQLTPVVEQTSPEPGPSNPNLVAETYSSDDDFQMSDSSNFQISENKLEEYLQSWRDILKTHANSDTIRALDVAMKRMKGVKTSNRLNSGLHMLFGSSFPCSGGRGKIPVNASSIQRRGPNMPRGVQTVGKGRRPGALPVKAPKRPHNLALNICNNLPNAKNH